MKCGKELRNLYIGGCLAQNLLINEGIATSCNGDDRGAITTYILDLLRKDSLIFRPDIYHIDKKNNKVYLRSDGIGPFGMSAEGFKPCLSYQYPLECPSGGISLSNVIRMVINIYQN